MAENRKAGQRGKLEAFDADRRTVRAVGHTRTRAKGRAVTSLNPICRRYRSNSYSAA
jgi:hypothetical protein